MLEYLKKEANLTETENGAAAYKTTYSDCLDFFSVAGAVRRESGNRIIVQFMKAYAENPDLAMKLLFYTRDVRGGLGERRVFRCILKWLADSHSESVKKNIPLIAEYGRYDDLLSLLGTGCEAEAVEFISAQLAKDCEAYGKGEEISLLAKWLPSINASASGARMAAKRISELLGMTKAEYRKTLSALRRRIKIIENNLREKDYSFSYEEQPSQAMLKYRNAFIANDCSRYSEYLSRVRRGEAAIHTGTIMPYEIVRRCTGDWGFRAQQLSEKERESLDVMWNSLEDFGGEENALVVVDGSGSMYGGINPAPIEVAISLGIYFAERNKGRFRNHFITFSENPHLIEIKGSDIAEKIEYCMQYDDVANTDLSKVFGLLLDTALKNNLPQSEMPSVIYIVTDMEFDCCCENSDVTNFEYAKKLFEENGYRLPKVVFWNVNSRNLHQPVTMNEQGAALVSGCTPRIFSMAVSGEFDPYSFMEAAVLTERYAAVCA